MLGLTLALACSAAPPQNGGGSVESWLADLERRTAARRAHAAEVWSAEGTAWLAGDSARLNTLLEAAPELQGPVLNTLEKAVAEHKAEGSYSALLQLLGMVMDPAGAERVYALIEALPADDRPLAARSAIARGSPAHWPRGRALVAGPPGALRQAAIQALLLQVPEEECTALAAGLAP